MRAPSDHYVVAGHQARTPAAWRRAAAVATASVLPLAATAAFAMPASAAGTGGYRVTATIAVGGVAPEPWAVGVDPTTGTAYVANINGGTVSVIDEATRTVTATIADDADPEAVAVDPTTHTVYVANAAAATVSVISEATRTVTATIAVGDTFGAIAVDPTTHTVYVTNLGDDTVSVINEATRTVTATITGVDSPWAIAVDPRTDAVYVISFDADVVAIDGATRAVTATIYPPGYGPLALAVDSTAGTVYVTDEEAVEGRANPGSVSVISEATNTVIGTITDGGGPEGVAVDSCRHAAYVANDGNGTVSVIKRSPASSASACP